MVVLMLGKTVIDQEDRAALQLVSERPDERVALLMNFSQEVMLAFDLAGWAQSGSSLVPDETNRLFVARRTQNHTAFMPDTAYPGEQLDRHGIEHLVADHHTLHARRQLAHPAHAGSVFLQRGLLAQAQATRQINDAVTRQRQALCFQRFEHLQRQCPGAGTELPDLAGLRQLQGLCHLRCQGPTKQRRHLWRSDKIAAAARTGVRARTRQGTEFGTVVGVIAQTRCVQRQRHEFVKANPATARHNGLRNMGLQGAR